MKLKQEKEKEFHDKAFSTGTRENATKFYSTVSSSKNFYEDFLLANCRDKVVLDYGCGPGYQSLFVSKTAASVTGVDISDTAVELARETARRKKVSNATFHAMDAEAMNFRDDTFNVIFGMGILHHLDLNKSLSEIARTLEPEGKAIFIEPLGHNPIINLYRRVTPSLRTVDEHPLLINDLKSMNTYFREVEIRFFHLCSIVATPFRKLPGFTLLLKALDTVDSGLFSFIPPARRFAWQTVIILSQPNKNRQVSTNVAQALPGAGKTMRAKD